MGQVTHRIDTTWLNNPVEFYPTVHSKEEYRDSITNLHKHIESSKEGISSEEANETNPVKHTYGDGLYIREIFMPRGQVIISKIHKVAHPFFLIKGKLSVLTEDGESLLQAPYYSITPAGTKRMLYTHTNSIVVTVHRTFETELDKIEKEIIAESFESMEEETI